MNLRETEKPSAAVNQNGLASLDFVLISPARNEAGFIELTLKSMVAQTKKPLKWVIVSDGSTDGTDEIVQRYAATNPWIQLLRLPDKRERNFGGKVHAFNAGLELLRDLDYQVIGNLDADLSFEPDYFEFLLNKFSGNPRLGVGGTPFSEGGATYDYRFASTEHVSGACQLFRKECFAEIGGYVPIKAGGIDLVAVTTARMKGWETKSFTEKVSIHHKKTQRGKHSTVKATFKSGYHDYLMGSHPLWQLFRSAYQMSNKPLIAGGALLFTGFAWATIKRAERPISLELVRFRRKEQMQRLRAMLRKAGGGSEPVLPRQGAHAS